MHWLFTGANALFVILAAGIVLRARAELVRAQRWSSRYTGINSRVTMLETSHESLLAMHRKLSGKFHAARAQDSETPAPPDVGPAAAGLRTPPSFCQNFQLAQVGGPLCDAARCECDYCTEMRFRRDQMKLELLPAARAATLASPRKRE